MIFHHHKKPAIGHPTTTHQNQSFISESQKIRITYIEQRHFVKHVFFQIFTSCPRTGLGVV